MRALRSLMAVGFILCRMFKQIVPTVSGSSSMHHVALLTQCGDNPGNGRDGNSDLVGECRSGVLPCLDQVEHGLY